MTEIMPKPRFEIGPCRCIERLPRRMQHFMYNFGYLADHGSLPSRRSSKLFILRAFSALTAEPERRDSDRDAGLGHTHYLFSDAIRLLLQ